MVLYALVFADFRGTLLGLCREFKGPNGLGVLVIVRFWAYFLKLPGFLVELQNRGDVFLTRRNSLVLRLSRPGSVVLTVSLPPRRTSHGTFEPQGCAEIQPAAQIPKHKAKYVLQRWRLLQFE